MPRQIAPDPTAEAARAVVSRASADGRAAVSVAIVDAHGDLVHFTRMPGAPARSITEARNKAYTACVGSATSSSPPFPADWSSPATARRSARSA